MFLELTSNVYAIQDFAVVEGAYRMALHETLHPTSQYKMPTILLTGGTGFLGSHLRAALNEPVVLLGRKKPHLLRNESWRPVDLSEPVALEKLAGGETLCHLAYSVPVGRENVAYNRHLLEAVNASSMLRRVVLVSSISVYGENHSRVLDEESPCYPVGEYPETKLACEMVWRDGLREDCELVVLRPTEIVGAGGKGLLSLIREAVDRPVLGAVKRSLLRHRQLRYVAVSNVVAAVVFCSLSPQASTREIFVVSDDHYPENGSYAAMQDFVRKLSGKHPLPSLPVPGWLVGFLARLSHRPLNLRQTFDSRKIHDAGLSDATTLADEVRTLVEVRRES